MGFRSLLLWGWRTDAACPEHCGRSDGQSMPSYGERLGGGAVRPLCRGVASSEAEMSFPLEGSSLPSSEAEIHSAIEGPEGSPRARRRCVTCSRVDSLPSSEAEIAGGPERGANGPHAGLL